MRLMLSILLLKQSLESYRVPIKTKEVLIKDERGSPKPSIEATLQSNDVAVACLHIQEAHLAYVIA